MASLAVAPPSPSPSTPSSTASTAEGRPAALEALISRVQTELGPFVKAPPLAPQLLAKPPFRFLHDVVSAVTAATGFAANSFTPAQRNALSITERPAKLAYLEELIRAVAAATGDTITAKPLKIVAGAEPEQTNRLLLSLAKAARLASSASAANARLSSTSTTSVGAAAALPTTTGVPSSSPSSSSSSASIGETREARSDTFNRGEAAGFLVDSAQEAAALSPPTSSTAAQLHISAPPRLTVPSSSSSATSAAAAAAAAATVRTASTSSSASPFVRPPDSTPAVGGAAASPPPSPALIALGVDGSSTSRTIALLAPLLTSPHLTDKLLARPPFRFLHDVVCGVMTRTGWGICLFSTAELDREAVGNNKDAKIVFLEKLRDAVGLQMRVPLSVRPVKVLAGLEPERTNELLQLLALGASRHADGSCSSADAVARVLAGETVANIAAVVAAAGGSDEGLAAPTPVAGTERIISGGSIGSTNSTFTSGSNSGWSGGGGGKAVRSSSGRSTTTGSSSAGSGRSTTTGSSSASGSVPPPSSEQDRDVTAGEPSPAPTRPSVPAALVSVPVSSAVATPVIAGRGTAKGAPGARPLTAVRRALPKAAPAKVAAAAAAAAASTSELQMGIFREGDDVGSAIIGTEAQSVPAAAAAASSAMAATDDLAAPIRFGSSSALTSSSSSTTGATAAGPGKHTRDIAVAATAAAAALSEYSEGSAAGIGAEGGDTPTAGGGGIRLGRARLQHGGSGGGGMGEPSSSMPSSGSRRTVDVEALQASLQALCAGVLPLGMGLEFVADDLEDMRREMAGYATESVRCGES